MAIFSDNPFNGIVAFDAQSCAEERRSSIWKSISIGIGNVVAQGETGTSGHRPDAVWLHAGDDVSRDVADQFQAARQGAAGQGLLCQDPGAGSLPPRHRRLSPQGSARLD